MKQLIQWLFVLSMMFGVFVIVPQAIGTGSYDVLTSECSLGGHTNAIQVRCEDTELHQQAREVLNVIRPQIKQIEADHPALDDRIRVMQTIIDRADLKSHQAEWMYEKFTYELVHFYMTIFLKSYSSYDNLYS